MFYTIGHSTRSIPDFVRLLRAAGADVVVDVRSVPRSRSNPQFNRDTFPAALASRGIEYRHIRELGGLRGKQRQASASANAFWENESFRNYAGYAATPAFRAGFDELRALGGGRVCAIMCAEALWWRCHRRIIADYLIAAGETVRHIIGPDKIEIARLTPSAVRTAEGTLIYPGKAAV